MIKLLRKIYNNIFYKDYMQIFFKKYYYIKKHQPGRDGEYIGNIFQKIKCKKYKIDITKLTMRYNCAIPITADLKPSTIFPHGLSGIFISQGAKIGEKCVIFQQVTIGSNTLKGSKHNGSPTIGNNVYIGAGAKIIGKVTIGDNCRIGANCVVVKDIPNNTTVVLGDNKLIYHNEPLDNTYYTYQVQI